MAMYTSGTASALTPEQTAALFTVPVTRAALAFNSACTTTIKTKSTAINVPIMRADPSAAWVVEGGEIAPSDATFDELTIVPKKVAALTIISRELAADSSPEAAGIIGDALVRDTAKKVDGALFASPVLASPAPPGLGGVTGISTVNAGATWDNLDAFAAATSHAEQLGTTVGSFVANPADVLSLATLKISDEARVPLLASDPSQPAMRTVQGIPLLSSPAVAAGVIWAMVPTRIMVALRQDASVDLSGDAYFSSDRVAVRSTLRVAFGFPQTTAVIKIVRS